VIGEAQKCQIIIDSSPQSGKRNMEIDGSLLEQVCENSSLAFVRIYHWNEPTITLGHFQKFSEVPAGPLAKTPCVKRLTGGGAILHDREITYSIALPAGHLFRHTPIAAYESVHTVIIELLQYLGVECGMRADSPLTTSQPTMATKEDEFLCFLRSDPRDIVSKGQKIVGSAQRRRKGCILQHGSILLAESQLTPMIPGLLNLWPDFDTNVFASQLAHCISSAICTPR